MNLRSNEETDNRKSARKKGARIDRLKDHFEKSTLGTSRAAPSALK